MDPTQIEGIVPSAQLRETLAGQTVLLAFSRGKDSIAAWLALRDAGVRVVPYHLYLIPGLEWVTGSLAYYEDWFGTEIINLPHPSLYRWLRYLTFQPPERCAVIEAAQITVRGYADVNRMLRVHFGLSADTWVCDGVRAADSPNRRAALASHGPVNDRARTQKVVWDWRKLHVMDAIGAAGIELPPDYAWFGRSFDGIDRRFLEPLRRHAPDDYARILEWFPLAGLELCRRQAPDVGRQAAVRRPGGGGFRDRAKREAERFRLATDSEYWIALCFRTPEALAAFMAELGLTGPDRSLPGHHLAAAVAARTLPDLSAHPQKRPCAGQLARRPVPTTRAAACTGTRVVGAEAELAGLLAALTAATDSEPTTVLDSPHHLIAYWPTRPAKDMWLAATGLDVLGDKYLDGDAAAAILGLTPQRRRGAASLLARRLRLSHALMPRSTMERTTSA